MKKLIALFLLMIISWSAFSQLNTDQYFYIGRSRIYFGNYVSAIENLNIVIKLRPNLPEPYFYRGMAKHYIDDFRGAKADYDKALEIKPFYPEAYMYRGMANYELKDFKEALNDYSKALEYKSDDQAIYNNRGITKAAMEDIDGAIADYSKAIDLDPLVANTYLNRSSAKQMKNDFDGAINDCNSAIKIRPHFASAYLMRGIAKFEKQDYASALKDYDLCIRLDPKMAQAYVNRGIVKHKLDDAQGAIPDYDMAIKLDPDIAVAWLNRGIAKESLKITGYNSDFAIAEQLDPKFAQFKKRLNEEQEREKQRRQYGFVLPSASSGQNSQNQTGKNSAKQLANQQIGQAQNNGPKNYRDSVSVERENGKGPVTKKRSHRNIVVNDGGNITETEITSGMVQNRNVKIELQPEFALSIFHKDSIDYERLQYYSMEVDVLNRKNNNQPFLLITNKPIIGNENRRAEEYNESIRFWDNAIQTDKKNSEAYFNRAVIYELLKNYDQAIDGYNKAIKIDGRNILAYFCRANAMAKRADFIRMPGILPEPITLNINGDKAVAYKPKEEEVIDYNEIIKDYESIIYMNPRFIFSWYNMGNIKVKKKNYIGAINDYSKAIELEPDFAEAYFNRGLTRIFLDDMDGGSLDLSKAGELGLIEAYNVIKRFCN